MWQRCLSLWNVCIWKYPLISPIFFLYAHSRNFIIHKYWHTHTNTNKNMTFELLKVCRQANPAWIELRIMYVRSTVTDRRARWVIINQNYCISKIELSFFFISLFRWFFSFHFLHISLFRWFRFISLISFRNL